MKSVPVNYGFDTLSDGMQAIRWIENPWPYNVVFRIKAPPGDRNQGDIIMAGVIKPYERWMLNIPIIGNCDIETTALSDFPVSIKSGNKPRSRMLRVEEE
jgi:hypothetical protein